MKRKSPILHKVRAYQKKNKKAVGSYTRGKGFEYDRSGHLANPTPNLSNTLTYTERHRLLHKLSVPEWYGWDREDLTFEQLPSGVKKVLLAEKVREQKIIHKFQNDPTKMQVELVLDHAKRLVDTGEDTFSAWNTAVGNCKYQYHGKGSLDPFGYEVKLTEEYMDKLEKYAKANKKEESFTKRLRQPAKEVERQLEKEAAERRKQAINDEKVGKVEYF